MQNKKDPDHGEMSLWSGFLLIDICRESITVMDVMVMLFLTYRKLRWNSNKLKMGCGHWQ